MLLMFRPVLSLGSLLFIVFHSAVPNRHPEAFLSAQPDKPPNQLEIMPIRSSMGTGVALGAELHVAKQSRSFKVGC